MGKKKDKKFGTVEDFVKRYSKDRVTPQVLHAIADYLCYRFYFLHTEGGALYVYDEQVGYYHPFDDAYALRFLEENAKDIGVYHALRSKDCKEIVTLLKSKIPETSYEKCKTNIYKVLFIDGCFNVRDKKVHKPCKNDYMFSLIDYPLDKDRVHTPSQETLDFIRRFTGGDPNKELFLWEIIGEMLSGFHNKFFYILRGPANSGKSTLANMMRRICGNASCVSLGIKELAGPFNIAELHGKKLMIDSDMDATALNARDISLLKKITGNDLLRGNRKYQQPFYFQCQAKLLVCLNGDFVINSSEDPTPLYKRAVFFRLDDPVPQEEQRCDLDAILDRDRPWFLQKAMEGLCRLYAHNFVFSGCGSPERYIINVSKMEKDEGIGRFVQESCRLEKDSIETVADIYVAYERFAEEYGYGKASKKYLSRFFMDEFGIEATRTSTERNYRGIRLLTDKI